MRYLFLIIVITFTFLTCSQNAQDENARAMMGAYAALLDKYEHLMDSVKSDSTYQSLVENKKVDLQMLLDKYQDEEAIPSLEIMNRKTPQPSR